MSAPASSGGAASGQKRKWEKPSSSGAQSSSHKGGSEWKRPKGDQGKPWSKPANSNKGPGGAAKPHAPGGNGKPWIKASEWKANTPVALTRQDRDKMKKERKALKPNADIIAEANKIWQVSFTQMSAGERSAKIDELLATIKGKVAEVGLKHDASRAIQIAIKHASEVQKHALLAELKGKARLLAEDHYGHYIIIKMLSNDTKRGDAKKMCLEEFKGHVTKLSSHPDSAKVLDFLYASAKAKEQSSLLSEFYSPEFVVFHDDPLTNGKNLSEILQAKPEKKAQIMENLRKYLDKSLEKSMLMFRFVHALLLQYLTHAPIAETISSEFLQNLFQFIPALHHSIDGCKIICHMLSVCVSAKDRKNILKHFKGLVGNMSERAEGGWVLSAALDVVDDTVLLEKVIFAELIPTIKEQLTNPYPAKIYLHILNSHDASIFSAEEQENYSMTGRWILNQADPLAKVGTKDGANGAAPAVQLSKKDPAQKRLELIACFLLPILSTLSTLPDTLAQLLRSNTGHHLLLEAIKEAWRLQHDPEAVAAQKALAAEPAPGAGGAGAGGKKGKKKGGAAAAAAAAATPAVKEEGDEDGDAAGADAPAAGGAAGGNNQSKFPPALARKLPELATHTGYLFNALVSECAKSLDPLDPSSTDARGAKANALEDRFAHYVVKRLLSGLTPAPHEFASKLLSEAIEPQLLVMATTNRPAFVLSSILETPALEAEATRLRSKLKPLLKEVVAAAGSAPAAPVVKAESAADGAEADGAKAKWQKKPVHAAHSTTSAGVALLAKLLQGLPTDKHPAASAAHAAPKHGQAKKGSAAASAGAASKAAAAAPATPAAKPSAAAAKSGKKGAAAAAAVAMDVDEGADESAATSATPATPAHHRRQWTHTALDGSKEARLHRTPAKPEGIAEDDEPAAAAAPAKTPAKAKATPAKAATAKKSAKKKAAAADEDMED